MGEEKGLTHLQRILRSLCFKTQWKYAVFWKLQHRDRMLLTWEDAYYDNNGPADPSDHMPSDSTFEILYDGHYLPFPLGLDVVKMSYPVYSLWEGIIGQVAVTGKHKWIFADKPLSCSLSPYDCCDGRQSQFSAGIRTTAIVAVFPHGVVQLGSPNMITEDLELVNHIKDIFCSIQDSIEFSIPNHPENSMQSSLYLSKISSQHRGLEIFNDFHPSSNKAISNTAHILSHLSPSLGICNNLSSNVLLHGLNQNKSSEVFNQHLRFESTKYGTDRTVKLHKPKSAIFNLEQQKHMQMNVLNKEKCVQENSSRSDMFIDSKHSDAPASYIFPRDKSYSDHSMQQFDEKLGIDYNSAVIGSVKFDSAVYLQSKELELPDQMKIQLGKNSEQKSDMEVSCIDTAIPSLTFPADCELNEALGTALKKVQGSSAWDESEKSETVIQNETPERLVNSHLTTKCGSDYLSEAVMGIVESTSSNVKSENSLCTSAESLVSAAKKSDTPNHVMHYSSLDGGALIHSSVAMEDGAHHHLKLIRDSKEVFVEKSSIESSLKALSNDKKQSVLHLKPAKVVRKRSRPRQSRRPQPADRQLIKDRLKDLRELVPNGSKCSINSLLERAVEHMLFLQSVTKHTEKIKKFDPSKFSDKAKGLLGSCSHDHGSSWVVEVGNEAEACPIVIENLNMNGQMLVEICEEGSHFLDIAEVLRSLDLAIIKGVTETRGEKTWASFVVEGQNNRRIHRMDILWALMQLLQPKTNIQ